MKVCTVCGGNPTVVTVPDYRGVASRKGSRARTADRPGKPAWGLHARQRTGGVGGDVGLSATLDDIDARMYKLANTHNPSDAGAQATRK